jgi:hypothetical protein
LEPIIFTPAFVKGIGVADAVVSPAAAGTTLVGMAPGMPVPTAVPTGAFPLPDAGPVGYRGVGTTVTVLWTSFTVTDVVNVLLLVVVRVLGPLPISPPGRVVGAVGAEVADAWAAVTGQMVV